MYLRFSTPPRNTSRSFGDNALAARATAQRDPDSPANSSSSDRSNVAKDFRPLESVFRSCAGDISGGGRNLNFRFISYQPLTRIADYAMMMLVNTHYGDLKMERTMQLTQSQAETVATGLRLDAFAEATAAKVRRVACGGGLKDDPALEHAIREALRQAT